MNRELRPRTTELILAAVLVAGAVLRFIGIGWDRNTHLHPDERFLTTVETSLQVPGSIAAYFDTANSSFNPHNTGHTFFVYGTLPIFTVRILGEWLDQLGYDQIHIVGRAVSASFDVASLLLLYLIGARLYSRRVGLAAAGLAAFAPLLIQHAHFFVVDSFANTFVLLAIYLALRVVDHGLLRDYALFGLAAGMAAASKISAGPVAGVLLLAVIVRLRRGQAGGKVVADPTAEAADFGNRLWQEAAAVALAALVSLVTFRVLQPYAFQSFSLLPNPLWLENLRSVAVQTSGRADFPPAVQWADRTRVWFSFKNLVLYGMGWPLGLTAWAGWAWALYRSIRGEWPRHLIPVVWTGLYFLWQGSGFTMAMRYQLPVYPTLILLGAWAFWRAWDRTRGLRLANRVPARWLVGAAGAAVALYSLTYGTALALNYVRPFTRYEASAWIYRNIPGAVNLVLESGGETVLEPIWVGSQVELSAGDPIVSQFIAHSSGLAEAALLPHVTASEPSSLRVTVLKAGAPVSQTAAQTSGQGQRLRLALDRPLELVEGESYELQVELLAGDELHLRGSVLVTETSWDDALPSRIEGRDGFATLYRGVNQELYWPDNEDSDQNGISDKQERIVQTLSEGDYLVITSSRQYGSVGRLPQRYPMTIAYYRLLFDCPAGTEIEVCAARATPQEQPGPLGYRLIATFERNPRLGPFEFHDQLSEESYTVYDHPKVLIFQKTAQFDPGALASALERVDLSHIVSGAPRDWGGGPEPSPTLTLPEARLKVQRSGGTWSDIFSRDSLINRSQPLAVIVWWLALGVLGLLAFPLVQAAFPGLRNGGYALSRLAALLFISWASWLAGSAGIPYGRGTILLAVLLMAGISAGLAWRNRRELASFVKQRRSEIGWVELLTLSFFVFDLLIRLGNPDLWHRYLGGEKPMDFAYLNAVIKSTTFPPYDPWYAGGYINYYYFGFVLVGTPIRLIGLQPSVAYNLVLPTLFATAAMAAYTIGVNLVARLGKAYPAVRSVSPRLAGVAAALALVVLGNLGTVRLIYGAVQEVGARASEGQLPGLLEAGLGLTRVITLQEPLPIALHHWYWDPSRAISTPSGEVGVITEFPFFTFLYADLHAHMIALPLTVLALAWSVSWVLAAKDEQGVGWTRWLAAIGLGALALGVLGPTNAWDYPVYWTLGGVAAIAAPIVRRRKLDLRAALEGLLTVAALLGLAYLMFQPYRAWYGAGYRQAELWEGSHTPLMDYLTVYGLFLVVLIPWLAWETREWMAATPLSALNRLRSRVNWLLLALLLGIFGVAYLTVDGVGITPLVALLVAWSGTLMLRPDQPMEKRIVLFLVGTGAAISLMVELVRLAGDVGRMNTVFKFYLQVWTLFSIGSAAALAWLLADLPVWGDGARRLWSAVFAAALVGAALYPVTATLAKVNDRMSDQAPLSLDGMAFMTTAQYNDLGENIPLEGDYHAIRWMQDNVQGSPVIVEAQIPEYRWGSRYAIYTGLPAVLGWNFHQRQQRAAVGDLDVSQRAMAVSEFYLTPSPAEALDFLQRYDVQYVIVGELERLYYQSLENCQPMNGGGQVMCDARERINAQWVLDVPASQCEEDGSGLTCPTGGLEKFDTMQTLGLLREVYRNGSTVIYEVLA